MTKTKPFLTQIEHFACRVLFQRNSQIYKAKQGFFSRFSANTGKFIFRNLEFRQQILEFRKKSLNFHGEFFKKNDEFRLKTLSLANFLSLDCLEFSEK